MDDAHTDEHAELAHGRDDQPQLRALLEGVTGATTSPGNTVEVFRNGDEIFPAMLSTIADAQRTIDFVTYVYWTGAIATRVAHALADRAQAGVRVRIVLDAVGSMAMDDELIDMMIQAGCQVERFRTADDRPSRLTHRTHRKLLVADERVAMTGGVGIAEEWEGDASTPEEWRDTHFRITGPAVRPMTASFIEHWVECGHHPFDDHDVFPDLEPDGDIPLLVLRGSSGPTWHSVGLAVHALIDAARERLRITTAYFVPGERTLQALCDAASRGVEVHLLLPGTHLDNRVTHLASADDYERLMECGVIICHYEQTMLHVKSITVDGKACLFGSANVDERSMRHNEEIALIALDEGLTRTLDEHFDDDLAHAEPIDLERWRDRPIWKKWAEAVVSPIEDWL